jgi:hypothetical protein
MCNRSIIGLGIAVLTACGAARPAQATFFSFASDHNSNGFTFGGSAGAAGSFTLGEFSRPNTFNLLVDDDNGPLATLSVAVEFRSSLTASGGSSTLIGGALYQHTYHISGMFGFYTPAGVPLLTVDIGTANPGFFTVPGTQNSWSSTGAVLGSDTYSDVTYTATTAFVTALGGPAIAAQYGIVLGAGGSITSTGPDDFGFSLSVLNANAVGINVAINPLTKAPLSAWRSESSFSGASSLGGIPTPGSAFLLGAGGILATMRRRSVR